MEFNKGLMLFPQRILNVFRTDAGQPTPALTIPSGTPMFTPCLVHEEPSNIYASKSLGPDRLHPKLIKWLATFLAEPLADLFNNCIATAIGPGDWKAAVICPIFKKGGGEFCQAI